ncbi:MAG: SRPBCC family protein [Solirubrobacteraceae bacterium]
MDAVTVETTIARPREEVFAYLADIANHAEFCDHFLVDWHLTREDSFGYGAGARFRIEIPLNRFPWADVTLVELEAPRRIVEAGRTGKFNRIRTLGVYELELASGDETRVRFTLQSETKMATDRFLESLGARRWTKRKLKKAMRRLQSILEEGRGRGTRPTVAGGPRKPATSSPFAGRAIH